MVLDFNERLFSQELLASSSSNEARCNRTKVEYCDFSNRFQLPVRNYEQQYAHIYAERLTIMYRKLTEVARARWGSDLAIKKLFELEFGIECIAIGTVYKQMDLKPNILRELSDDHNLSHPPIRERYISEADELILEDELQRIRLVGNVNCNQACTGSNIAVRGREAENGRFVVDDYCFAGLQPQVPRPIIEEDCYIAVLSGLDIGGKSDVLSLQLTFDMLAGFLGNEPGQQMMARVVRIIFAGNSLSSESQDKDVLSKAKYLSKKICAASVEGIKELDSFLVHLATNVEVDLMSGEFDPSNYLWPQQGMQRCMFPRAAQYSSFHTVTNPYEFQVAGVRVLATSGQNINDIYKYTNFETRLEIMEKTLEWGHIAPTAPDTLGCYPYFNEDPFILDHCPHLYIAGNQPQFEEKSIQADGKSVRVICVPPFQTTRMFILINLRTLECQPVQVNHEIQFSEMALAAAQ